MNNYFINNRTFNRHQLEEWAWDRIANSPEWEKSHLLFLLEWLGKTEHINVQTSGSTGVPKTIRILKENMKQSARMTADYFQLPHGTIAILAIPSMYIGGKMMIVRALEMGWRLLWTEPLSVPDILREYPIDFAAFTPMQAAGLINKDKSAFEKIRTVILGGGIVSRVLEEELKRCSNRIVITYGMTETISHIAIRDINVAGDDGFFTALPSVSFSQDERGCLVITAPHLTNDVVVTNDVVNLVSNSQFEYLGRYDNVINSGGIKIFPEKIEHSMTPFISKQFFISATMDDVLGERATLFIEDSTWSNSEVAVLKDQLKRVGGHTALIKEIVFVPHFNYTATGKLIRKNYRQ
ncbi:MAG: AMP-binding protein [Crocinitomicaceae bacterium]|nr:AMP-binding protein [Crocinitomicaceae bacterium]